MKITQVATSLTPEILEPATGLRPILSPVGEPPLQVFRLVLYVSLPTGGPADRLVLDTASAPPVLSATFQLSDIDIEAPVPAEGLPESNDTIIVTLEVPRQVQRVDLTGIPNGNTLEFYRLDGTVLSGEPTVTVQVQDDAAQMDQDANFIDRRFALRRQNGEALAPGNISRIQLRSFPTGPRLGLAAVDEPLDPIFFWQMPGEIRDGPLGVEASTEFTTALERYLNGLETPLSQDPIQLALVAESDAPCQLNMTNFEITYYLVKASFPIPDGESSPPNKQVLRFQGDRVSAQSISLELPSNAQVLTATLEIAESLRGDRTIPSNGGPNLDAALPEASGIYLSSERWVAKVVTPPQAIEVSGLALGLVAIADQTELRVELQADFQGLPSGRKLAEGLIQPARIGQPDWIRLLFAEPVILPAQPHWILVCAARGAAVWLVQAESNIPTRVLENSEHTSTWVELSIFEDREVLHKFFSPAQTSPVETEASPIILTIDNRTVPSAVLSEPNRQGIRVFQLTDALALHLSNQTSNLIPLSFMATIPGIITVYPPYIEYDLTTDAA